MSREITNPSGKLNVAAELDISGNFILLNQNGINFREGTGGGTNIVTLKAPAAIAADFTLTLPVDDGNPNDVLQTNGSGTLTWGTALSAATQTDMTTATSTTTYVSPARAQFHPGVAKAWAYFDGTTGVTVISASYNVSNVVRNSVGNYTITFTTPFSSSNYAVGFSGSSSGPIIGNPLTLTTTTCIFTTSNTSGAAADDQGISVVFYGVQ